FYCPRLYPVPPSFPTRRSSDLGTTSEPAVGYRRFCRPILSWTHLWLRCAVDKREPSDGRAGISAGSAGISAGSAQTSDGWAEISDGWALIGAGSAQTSDGSAGISDGWALSRLRR